MPDFLMVIQSRGDIREGEGVGLPVHLKVSRKVQGTDQEHEPIPAANINIMMIIPALDVNMAQILEALVLGIKKAISAADIHQIDLID